MGHAHKPSLRSTAYHFKFSWLLQDLPEVPAFLPRESAQQRSFSDHLGLYHQGCELRTGHIIMGPCVQKYLEFQDSNSNASNQAQGPSEHRCWVTAWVTGPRNGPRGSSVPEVWGYISSSSTKHDQTQASVQLAQLKGGVYNKQYLTIVVT